MAESDRTVQACPHCDSTNLRKRAPTDGAGRPDDRKADPEAAWWCRGCQQGVETPTERPSREGGAPSGEPGHYGLGAELVAMDADAWPPEGSEGADD
jgi:hypothetical protein